MERNCAKICVVFIAKALGGKGERRDQTYTLNPVGREGGSALCVPKGKINSDAKEKIAKEDQENGSLKRLHFSFCRQGEKT